MPTYTELMQVEERPDKSVYVPFLRQHYYRHEPLQLMYLAKHAESIDIEHSHDFLNYLHRSTEILLTNSLCFSVRHNKTSDLKATLVSHVDNNPKFNQRQAPPESLPGYVFDLYDILKKLPSISPSVHVFRDIKFRAMEEVKIFEVYPEATRAANVTLLCVAEEYRGKGLAKFLISELMNWARDNQVDVVYGLFTSIFAQKAAQGYGFKRLKDIDLLSIKELKGRPIFEGMKPHVISIMAYKFKEDTDR